MPTLQASHIRVPHPPIGRPRPIVHLHRRGRRAAFVIARLRDRHGRGIRVHEASEVAAVVTPVFDGAGGEGVFRHTETDAVAGAAVRGGEDGLDEGCHGWEAAYYEVDAGFAYDGGDEDVGVVGCQCCAVVCLVNDCAVRA